MTRDEFEAILWRHWPTRGPKAGDAVDAILDAADQYGITRWGITAERRAALNVPAPPDLRTVHYQVPCPQRHAECKTPPAGCNTTCWTARDILATTVLADVDCRKCLRSAPYLEALAGGLEATR